MKGIRSAGKAILGIIIMLALTIPVFAATVEVGGGSYNIIIHKCMTPSGSSVTEWENVENDGTEQIIPNSSKPVNNIEFTIYSAKLIDGKTLGSTAKEDYTLMKLNSGVTDMNGELIFSNIPEGVYYVEETLSATSTETSSFFVRLPMTDATGSGFLTDVHVYPKNNMTDGTISKKIYDENNTPTTSRKANVGDEVTWLITATVPGEFANVNTATNDYFWLIDNLDASLTYKKAVVKLGDTVLTEGDDYKVIVADNQFVMYFTPTGLGKLAAALTGTNATITVELTTIINDNSYNGMMNATGDYVITNQASYEWKVGNDNGGETTLDPDSPSVLIRVL